MFSLRLIIASVLAIYLAGCQTTGSTGNYSALIKTATAGKVSHMPVGTEVVAPYGYITFCQRNPSECTDAQSASDGVKLSEAQWAELNDVNNYVNRSVRPVEDRALYSKVEWWSYPSDNAGDCEDYALLKRKLLIERGWPASSLLLSVVKEWSGAGHAVLLVVTDKGEFVLDNQSWAIASWQDAPYTWVKRQSTKHPYVWVGLDNQSIKLASLKKEQKLVRSAGVSPEPLAPATTSNSPASKISLAAN